MLNTGLNCILCLQTAPKYNSMLKETHFISSPFFLFPICSLSHSNMYWIDWLEETGSALIEKASMDGSNRQVIVDSELSRPYDLTLDIENGKLYFIDGYHDTISSTNLDGSNRQQLHLFPSTIVPFSLVFHDQVLYWTERRMRLISRLTVGERQLGNVSVMTVRPAGLVMIAPQPQCEFKYIVLSFYHSLPVS